MRREEEIKTTVDDYKEYMDKFSNVTEHNMVVPRFGEYVIMRQLDAILEKLEDIQQEIPIC